MKRNRTETTVMAHLWGAETAEAAAVGSYFPLPRSLSFRGNFSKSHDFA